MIHTKSLGKSFRSDIKQPGLVGSLKSFFSREWTTKHAVENFDLDVAEGEIVGLLGPNGAGKTTLMKMFTGIIVPSSGDLQINGFRPWDRQKDFRKKIALVMGQKSQLWWDIPAMDSFLLLQKYYEIPDEEFNAVVLDMPVHSPAITACAPKLAFGGRLACYAPTTSQLEACWKACEKAGLVVEWAGELMERQWGLTSKGGMRPVNGPFGHTAFLLVAQKR